MWIEGSSFPITYQETIPQDKFVAPQVKEKIWVEDSCLECAMDYPVGLNIQYNLSIINRMANLINQSVPIHKDIALWARGSSGAIIASIIASSLNGRKVKIQFVDKPGESSHRGLGHLRETPDVLWYNIIVDDLVSTCKTVNAIADKMRENHCEPYGLVVSGCLETKRLYFNPTLIIAGNIISSN